MLRPRGDLGGLSQALLTPSVITRCRASVSATPTVTREGPARGRRSTLAPALRLPEKYHLTEQSRLRSAVGFEPVFRLRQRATLTRSHVSGESLRWRPHVTTEDS